MRYFVCGTVHVLECEPTLTTFVHTTTTAHLRCDAQPTANQSLHVMLMFLHVMMMFLLDFESDPDNVLHLFGD